MKAPMIATPAASLPIAVPTFVRPMCAVCPGCPICPRLKLLGGSIISVAGELGFEPRLTESEFAVLPLNYSPKPLTYRAFAVRRKFLASV